jgi:hypothetical protein
MRGIPWLRAAALGGLMGLAGLLPSEPMLQAKPRIPEIETVPVSRLIQNLETRLTKDPDDFETNLNLARTHAMAYALKTEMATTDKAYPEQGYYARSNKRIPFSEVKSASSQEEQKRARDHLSKANEYYQKSHKLQPDEMRAWLGLAWITEQQGHKAKAVEEYRQLITKSWDKEKDQQFRFGGQQMVTVEAASYLIPLLDEKKDAKEIAELKERTAKLGALRRRSSPIVIPLRAGVGARDLEDRHAEVAFDADGSGERKRWSWITPDAGWLVYAPNGKGEITSALQMFGNVTFWLFWENGYHALAALDDNRDGWLTDKELAGLALWRDANGNGVCEPAEVQPLSAYGIVGISCRFQLDETHPDKIAFAKEGVRFRDGTIRPTFDLILHSREQMKQN